MMVVVKEAQEGGLSPTGRESSDERDRFLETRPDLSPERREGTFSREGGRRWIYLTTIAVGWSLFLLFVYLVAFGGIKESTTTSLVVEKSGSGEEPVLDIDTGNQDKPEQVSVAEGSNREQVEADSDYTLVEQNVDVVAQVQPYGHSPAGGEANRSLRCIPRACRVPKHFISEGDALKHFGGRRPFIMLASYPGSGNTWVRSIIEAGTRIWTGTVYNEVDQQLVDAGFKGEPVDPWERRFPTMSAIKTHWPYYKIALSPKTKAIVNIMRSPLNAFLAEFDRQHAKSHVAQASDSSVRTGLDEFLTHKRASWMQACDLYAGSYFWNNTQGKHIRTSSGVLALLANRTVFGSPASMRNVSVPVLTVFYEDFVLDFEGTSRIMFTFMKEFLKGAMPSVDDAVDCAILAKREEERMHRKKKSVRTFNPYTDPSTVVAQRGTLNKSCHIFRECWVEDKFGRCEDAVVQTSTTRTKPSSEFKNEVCP